MKIDRGSIGFRLLVPIFTLIAAVFLLLLALINRVTFHIQEDYQRFSAAAASSQVSLILEMAASDLITAKLTGNEIVVAAKKETVQEALVLSWLRSRQEGIISGLDGKVLSSTLDPARAEAILAVRSEGAFSYADATGHYLCESRRFPLWGWTVTTVIGDVKNTAARKEVTYLLPLVAGASLLLVAGLLFILWNNLQRPVASLVDSVREGRTVEGTGVSEFDQIGSAINEALERIREQTRELSAQLEERKKAEADVRDKEERIRLLLNSTAEGIYGVDTRGICTFCNPAGLKMLGYESEQGLLGKNIHAVIHHTRRDGRPYPESECTVHGAYHFERGTHVEDDIFWRGNGTSFPVEYWSYPVINHGVTIGAVVTFIDITERKRSEEFIRNILETVDEGFLVVDREHTILAVNRSLARMVGASMERIVGSKCHEIMHQGLDPCTEHGTECTIDRVLETGKPCSAVHMHKRGAEEIMAETKTYPLRNEAGAITMVIMTVTDITEKSRLEQQLRQAQKMEAIGQLAGGIAHDFNNILTAITGYATFFTMRTEEGGQLRHYADQILQASDKAAKLTRQILAFSRKQMITPRPVRINEIIHGMEKMLLRLLAEDIEIRMDLTPRDTTVMADSGQIEQVLLNLATNARDAMQSGGTLFIRTEVAELEAESSGLHGVGTAGSYVVLEVSDTGMGMDEQTKERIFDPFFTTKEVGRGTGLGLAIVYGIIKQHGGQITVHSEPGKGTTFKIYFPLEKRPGEEQPGRSLLHIAGGTETVLLAEDNAHVRDVLQLVLQEAGYRVVTADDGEDAVRKFRENAGEVKLCLLDVIMPKKNGKDSLAEIRTIRPDMPVIFMSGYTADVIRGKDIVDQDAVFLAKPLAPRNLLKKVREVLDASPDRTV
jgi:two-component system NtrC family sensor kinase